MLREAGYRQRSDSRELVLADPDNDAEFFFLRPRDIAIYVGSGPLDVGITGRDLLLDSGAPAEAILPLGFGAPPSGSPAARARCRRVADLAGLRVATSYPGLVASTWPTTGVGADVIRLDGAVETSVRLGVADVDRRRRVRPARRCARPGWRSSASRSCTRRRCWSAGRGAGAARVRAVGPSAAGRPGRSAVRADGLRRRRPSWSRRRSRSLPASSRRPCRRCTTAAGSPVRAMVPRKRDATAIMDELWDVGARASWSPTSMPADCDRDDRRNPMSRSRPPGARGGGGGVGGPS